MLNTSRNGVIIFNIIIGVYTWSGDICSAI